MTTEMPDDDDDGDDGHDDDNDDDDDDGKAIERFIFVVTNAFARLERDRR